MKRKINEPDIAVKLSIKAYFEAEKEFNKKQEDNFEAIQKETKVKTVSSLLLKEEHIKTFITLLNYYREKLSRLNQIFNGSDSITTHIYPLSMYVQTGRLAAHLKRANNTIRARLRRLEKAGIIKVVFHGHKKPLEIIFDKNTCLIFDKLNLEYVPETKFLNLSKSVLLDGIGIKANNKESTFSRTNYNITITERGVLQNETSFVSENSSEKSNPSDSAIAHLMQNNSNNTKNISRTTKISGTTETNSPKKEKRKKVPAKKEKSSNDSAERYKNDRSNELKRRKIEALRYFSLEFFAYLIANLFPDKYFSPIYRIETLKYIAKHYFNQARTIKSMQFLLKNYKKRVDISKKWIENYKSPDNKPFDTTYFFPKAYLDIEKVGSSYLSFKNTEKFLKKGNEWEKLNGYNRNTNDKLRHKFNKIAREFENGYINYDTALERVKSLTNKTDEYIKQLNARNFGIYKNMEKN